METQKTSLSKILVLIFSGVALVALLVALIVLVNGAIRQEQETHRLLAEAFGAARGSEIAPPATTIPKELTDPPVTEEAEPAPVSVDIVSVDLSQTPCGISNATSYGVDKDALTDMLLSYHPEGGGPWVLILHSHANESYAPEGVSSVSGTFSFTSDLRNETVFAVGEALADVLRAAGIGVIHADDTDKTTEAIIRKYRQVYPSLTYVLDLHRDGIVTTDNRIVRSDATIGDLPAAQLMLAVGADTASGGREGWQKDLAAAQQLADLISQSEPGLMRSTFLRPESLGQTGAPCIMNLYVGTTGNTLSEAIASVRLFAKYYAIFILRHTV